MNLEFTRAGFRTRYQRAALAFASGILVLAALFFFVRTFLPSLTQMTHSFPAYYMASRLILTGEWDERVYDDEWFGERVLELTGGRISENMSNPPGTSFVLVPLAWLDLASARLVWQVANLVLLFATFWLLARALQVGLTIWSVVLAAFVCVYPPLVENFRVGQAYVLLLFLFTLTLWAETYHRMYLAGIALALALSIKLSGAPVLLLLLVRRSWTTFLVTIGSATVFAAFSFLVLGSEGWFAFIRRTAANATAPAASHVAYQSVPGLFQHLFVSSTQFNPTPMFEAPWLAPILTLGVSIVALGITLWFGRRSSLDQSFAAVVTLSLCLFPLASEYHYTLLLLPLAVMAKYIAQSHTRGDMVWLGLILFLLYVPMNWNAARWNEPAWALFAYPRFYGGTLMWVWLVWKMAHTRQVANELC